MRPKIPIASFTLSALKNTHAAVTYKKFARTAAAWPIRVFGTFFSARVITFITPCMRPQTTNVQPVPCQIPLTRNTIRMLTYVRTAPFLLPPSGM